MANLRIMIVSSDSFSDLYGGELAQELNKQIPEATLFGIGGTYMRQSGVKLLYDISDLEKLGGFESLKTSHLIKRLIQRVSESIDKLQPKLVIQIGLPVFSLRLIELAKTKKIPVLYYNTPLNWSSDIKVSRLATLVDKVIGVSHYEVEICRKHNINIEFTGHPLTDIVQKTKQVDLVSKLDLNRDKPIVAMFAGRRESEVRSNLPTFLKAVKKFQPEIGAVQTLLAVPSSIRAEFYQEIISKYGLDDIIITNDIHAVFHTADVMVVTSGPASIEAALARVPAIAVHKIATPMYFIEKILSRTSHFAMINFLMQEDIMPELIQNDFSESKVAAQLHRFLYDHDARQQYFTKLERLPEELGLPGAVVRAVQAISDMLSL